MATLLARATVACFALVPVLVVRTATAGGLSFVQEVEPRTDAIAVSADGLNLYAPDFPNDLRVFTRDAVTGQLTLLQTLSQGVGGVDGILRSDGVAVSPDGRCVYATSQREDNMATFSRNLVTGALTFVGVTNDGAGGVTGLQFPSPVHVSSDDLHVYVGAEADSNSGGSSLSSVVVFGRTPPGCALTHVETELGGVLGLGRTTSPPFAIAPDGNHVYVAGRILEGGGYLGGVTVLDRSQPSGHLTVVQQVRDGIGTVKLGAPLRSITVSPDGANVYVASSGDSSIVTFSRDAGSGALTFVEANRDGGIIDAMKFPRAVVVSPDGTFVYVTSVEDRSVVVFRRDTATGRLRFLQARQDPNINPPHYVINAEANALQAVGNTLHVGTTVLAVDTCGNGNRGVDEQCDDGNLGGGDGCSPTCRLELCGAAPSVGCRGTMPGGAALTLRDRTIDTKDQLQWKFFAGDATVLADFGDPLTTATYVVCVYDGSANAQPLLASAAPSGGLCKNDAPCWQAKTTEYRYQDKLLTPDGLEKIQLKEGLVDGQTKLQFKGKGINLVPPVLPLTLPVTVQVKNTATSACWEAVYGTARKNEPTQFKARND